MYSTTRTVKLVSGGRLLDIPVLEEYPAVGMPTKYLVLVVDPTSRVPRVDWIPDTQIIRPRQVVARRSTLAGLVRKSGGVE